MSEHCKIRWGVVATVKANLRTILTFVAWHLDKGANRIFLYLDAPNPDAEPVLRTHPNIDLTVTDQAYWDNRGGRPAAHQPRQITNVQDAYRRAADLDWLTHVDVDEFLIPQSNIAETLSAAPDEIQCLRMRPIEPLEGRMPDGAYAFKAFHIPQKDRNRAAKACFPNWGEILSGGFLSHVAGKLFLRTGIDGLQPRIHNARLPKGGPAKEIPCPAIEIAHFHASTWDQFLHHYRFRMSQGSYRPQLQAQSRDSSAASHHTLFRQIENALGTDGLHAFYDEINLATPDLLERLDKQGLLRVHHMDFDKITETHFGQVPPKGTTID